MISGLWPKIFLKDFHIRFLAFRLLRKSNSTVIYPFLAPGHSLKKISSKISSLQATKESVGVLGIAFGKKSLEEILIKILLTQEIKKGDRMKKKRDFWP